MPRTMPWENEGKEFDAERAKTWILALDADYEALKAKFDTATTELETANTALQQATTEVEAEKARVAQLTEAVDSAKNEYGEQVATTQAERDRLKFLYENGIPAELSTFVTGTTVKELQASYEQVTGAFGAYQQLQETQAPTGRFVTGNEYQNHGESDVFEVTRDEYLANR